MDPFYTPPIFPETDKIPAFELTTVGKSLQVYAIVCNSMQKTDRKKTVVGTKSVKWQNTGPNNCRYTPKMVRKKTVVTEIKPPFWIYGQSENLPNH